MPQAPYHLSQYQYDVLTQIARGPEIGVFVLRTTGNDAYLDGLIQLGLIHDVSHKIISVGTYRAVILTEAGLKLCSDTEHSVN
jgi:hypothetical protein